MHSQTPTLRCLKVPSVNSTNLAFRYLRPMRPGPGDTKVSALLEKLTWQGWFDRGLTRDGLSLTDGVLPGLAGRLRGVMRVYSRLTAEV